MVFYCKYCFFFVFEFKFFNVYPYIYAERLFRGAEFRGHVSFQVLHVGLRRLR